MAWLPSALNKGVLAVGPILRKKATENNKKRKGPSTFKATDGWLKKFKKRQEIRTLKIRGTSQYFYFIIFFFIIQSQYVFVCD